MKFASVLHTESVKLTPCGFIWAESVEMRRWQ